MINLDKIRVKLLEAIKQSGMSHTQLASLIGVCHQTIGSYLYHNRMPALDTFAKLCAVLDLDANEILCVDEYES